MISMSMRGLSAIVNGVLLLFFAALFSGLLPDIGYAKNVSTYSDVISDSRPLGQANHTFTFTIKKDVPAGAYFDFDFPTEFTLLATSSFDVRNVEMLVNGTPRLATSTADATYDGVIITTGSGGRIRYTLNSSTGLSAEDIITLKVGNQTSNAYGPTYTYSTSTGTTTIPGDIEPIVNSSTTGTYTINMSVTGASDEITADFQIAVVDAVGVGPADTTETVPPYRFNGAPDGEIGGTTLSVEISLETDEFAICKWSTASGTDYFAMPNTFDNTGFSQVVHSSLVSVQLEALNTFYVRCIDDEGNYNTDDYIIAFLSPPPPSGTPNAEGNVEGDGTGSGDSGTGGGSGGGAQSSGSDGQGNTAGSSGGSGGSGGGSGGSKGPDSSGSVGGGFETRAAPYRSGDAKVIINGYAFPGSTVYALVDGYNSDTSTAGNDGKYSVTIDAIARGVYTFGVYAVDQNGVKSSTFSTSFTVTGGRTSSLSNINVMPSILVTPDPVDIGQTVTISGYSIPDATVTIENQRDKSNLSRKTFTTTSGSDGAWSVELDTSNFSRGTYKVKAKAQALDGSVSTNFSEYTYYGVGQEAEGQISADLNTDGKINLTDFSILLFWWGSDGGNSNPSADINRDGKVSLTDFSIMLFNWTG